MLEIITADKAEIWNKTVKSYKNWDIYYLNEYAVSFQHHGDGAPLLICYESEGERFCYVVMKRDIAEDTRFSGELEKGRYFDYEAPYGYGGPLCDAPLSEKMQRQFAAEMMSYARDTGVVEQFVRFHPLLYNHNSMPYVFYTRYLHQTVYMDLESPELIMSNMDSKNRNMVRKAMKNDVKVVRRNISEYTDFVSIYEETMKKDNADDYYYFAKEYFEDQLKLENYACMFYAMKDEVPVAAAIMYYNDRFMHYHLAGSRTEYRNLAAGNLLLYEAACWGSRQGIGQFHLGGGLVEDDKLFGFKKQFNKNGRLPFYVGRTIFDRQEYDRLLRIRKKLDPEFNMDNGRMTQYRA